jgi:hypothetical protein
MAAPALRPHPPANPAGAIYGTILLLAVIAPLAGEKEIGIGHVFAATVGTAVVFFLAHLYAELLDRRMQPEHVAFGAELRSAVRNEAPILEAATLPSLALLLAIVGLVGRNAAINVALAVGLVELFAWGLAHGRALGVARPLVLLTALVDLGFGAVIVVLKVLLH